MLLRLVDQNDQYRVFEFPLTRATSSRSELFYNETSLPHRPPPRRRDSDGAQLTTRLSATLFDAHRRLTSPLRKYLRSSRVKTFTRELNLEVRKEGPPVMVLVCGHKPPFSFHAQRVDAR